jgi:medium-chain acyl-[acyl-carrier-protein] hydrolase
MGALLAYELTRELERTGAPDPLPLIVSGFHAPHLPARGDPLHVLPDRAPAAPPERGRRDAPR